MHGKPMTDSRRIIEYPGDGDHFGEFPITADIIDDKYRQNNGDFLRIKEQGEFMPIPRIITSRASIFARN